jgi:hypothetical protein
MSPRHHLVDAAGGVEQVLVGELVLRIEWRVAVGQDAEADAKHIGVRTEHLPDLLVAPDVERPLHLVRRWIGGLFRWNAIGVFGGIESARLVCEVALDVGQRVGRHVGEERIARHLRRLQIREDELRLVVQHLLEVGNAPVAIHRVTMESAADVIAHAAERHRSKRYQHHVARFPPLLPFLPFPSQSPRMLAEQKEQLRRSRKLRRVAEATALRVE